MPVIKYATQLSKSLQITFFLGQMLSSELNLFRNFNVMGLMEVILYLSSQTFRNTLNNETKDAIPRFLDHIPR